MLEKQQFPLLLNGLEKLIRQASSRYPEFREKPSEFNLIAQVQLRHRTQWRAFTFRKGKVNSQATIIPQPDMAIYFEDAAPYLINVRGNRFSPPKKSTASTYALTLKSMIYSKKKLLYPMKRIGSPPDGERNPQNRGISVYERINRLSRD